MNRTDLASESVDGLNENLAGISRSKKNVDNIEISVIDINTEDASNKLSKPKGRYIEASIEDLSDLTATADIADSIRELINDSSCVLVVGLGNHNITPDALGPKVIDSVISTRHISEEIDLPPVCAIAPGVLGQTGIEVLEIIRALCEKIGAKAIITVDALASNDVEKIGKSIQITNAGIVPGSGVKNKRAEISQKTVGVPVIAIGMPTVIDYEKPSMMVTSRDIDKIIENASMYIALSINQALFSELSLEDIRSLI